MHVWSPVHRRYRRSVGTFSVYRSPRIVPLIASAFFLLAVVVYPGGSATAAGSSAYTPGPPAPKPLSPRPTASGTPSGGLNPPTAFPPGARHGTLTFDDEFSGTGVDTSRWATKCDGATPQDPSYCGGAQQYFSPTALSVSGGALHITASPTPMNGHPYTSGIVWTNGKFGQTYGYWEMRAQVPAGIGMWPAFWGVPNNSGGPPELDVMEMYMGTSTSAVDYNIHWKGCGGECDHGYETNPAGNLTQGYHTFAMDWRADHVTWYVDGATQWTQTAAQATIPNQPFCVIIQLAVGSDWNNEHGVGETAMMDVDYVRIFK